MTHDPRMQAAIDAAFRQAALDERTRVAAIFEAGSARPILARKLALTTDMSAEDALAFMAGLPPETKVGTYRTIAERAAEQVECGDDGTSAEAAALESRLRYDPKARAAKGFDDAIGMVNATRESDNDHRLN